MARSSEASPSFPIADVCLANQTPIVLDQVPATLITYNHVTDTFQRLQLVAFQLANLELLLVQELHVVWLSLFVNGAVVASFVDSILIEHFESKDFAVSSNNSASHSVWGMHWSPIKLFHL